MNTGFRLKLLRFTASHQADTARSTTVVRSKAFEKPLKTCVHTHAKRSHSHVKDPAVHVSQSSVDYENTKIIQHALKSVSVLTENVD